MNDAKTCSENRSDGLGSLLSAAASGELAAAKAALAGGSHVDERDAFGSTPLMYAAARGHGECLVFLLESGASVCAADAACKTAMDWASDNGREACVAALETWKEKASLARAAGAGKAGSVKRV